MKTTWFDKEQIAKYIKAFAILAGLAGQEISPDQEQAILVVAGLVYTAVTLVQGVNFKAKAK